MTREDKTIRQNEVEGVTPNESEAFNAEANGQPDPAIRIAEERLRAVAKKTGYEKDYQQFGAAYIASLHDSEAQRCDVGRRTFLHIGLAGALAWLLDIVDDLLGNALWDALKSRGWIPKEWMIFEPDETIRPISPGEWLSLEHELNFAIQRRDFQTLKELAASTPSGFGRSLTRAITYHLQGRIGDSARWFDDLRTSGLIQRLPVAAKFFVLRYAARPFSTVGKPEISLLMYDLLRAYKYEESLSPVDRVLFWRDEMNHCIQTAKAAGDYYSPKVLY